ncbi:hypothetical protein TNCV_1431661 [Trichonephila clavipes]|nr:hypothetical protein TNCV_1431661 [Trichonephila clavipes]
MDEDVKIEFCCGLSVLIPPKICSGEHEVRLITLEGNFMAVNSFSVITPLVWRGKKIPFIREHKVDRKMSVGLSEKAIEKLSPFSIHRAAYVSFGGLLMRLQGDPNNLHGFEVDNHVYLLLKKLAF